MFGRKLALTTVKVNNEDPAHSTIEDVMTIEEIADLARRTIIGTIGGVAGIAVATAGALSVMRMTEHVIKYYYR